MISLIVERSETVYVLQLTSKLIHYYHCTPLVKMILLVVKSLIYQFTMILVLSPRQGGSNGGQITKISFFIN
jgi:hypothetical protein